MSRSYFRSLDGLRGSGILFVLFYHYFGSYRAPWLGFGWVWVEMFFVQSGYLITSILLASKGGELGAYLKEFYWRRSLRILPPYVAYVVFFALSFLAFRKPVAFPEHFPYLVTYTYNFTRLIPGFHFHPYYGHLWSLSVEEQFYLAWPLIIYFLPQHRLRQVLLLFMGLAPLCRWILAAYLSSHHTLAVGSTTSEEYAVGVATYTFTLSQLDGFAYGAAIAVFRLNERLKHPGRWAAVLSCLVVAGGLLNLLASDQPIDLARISSLGLGLWVTRNFQHVWSYSLVGLIFMLLMVRLMKPDYRGVFTFRPLVSAGKIVYGLYVYHFAILDSVRRFGEAHDLHPALSFAICVALTTGLAALSFVFFEARFLRLKNYWKPKRAAVLPQENLAALQK